MKIKNRLLGTSAGKVIYRERNVSEVSIYIRRSTTPALGTAVVTETSGLLYAFLTWGYIMQLHHLIITSIQFIYVVS